MNNHKALSRGAAIVSYHDFANEAWLYMQQNQLSQVAIVNGSNIIGTLTKAQLDALPHEKRLQLDVKDLLD